MSRVERLRQHRRRKWITIGVLSGIVLIGLIVWYYVAVQLPMWKERDEVKQTIMSKTELAKIERFHKFVTEDVYHVAIGRSDEGELIYVSLSEDGDVETYQAADGISREEMVKKHKENVPDAHIERVMPGIWRGFWVWEVFYRLKEEKAERAIYDYYDVTTGELLETYRLRKAD